MAEIKVKVKLKPFPVPSYVYEESGIGRREDGWGNGLQETKKHSLCDLSDEVLEELCKEFREAVFDKKNKATSW